jgi:hypothetical protein
MRNLPLNASFNGVTFWRFLVSSFLASVGGVAGWGAVFGVVSSAMFCLVGFDVVLEAV